MNRATIILSGVLLSMACIAVAQEQQQPPQPPEDAFAPQQLVAWSRYQEPQPAPQPKPPKDDAVPRPDQPGTEQQESKPPAGPDSQPATKFFTGKIVNDGGKYVLKVGGNTSYDLDRQDNVQQYENQSVKVVGNLDSASNKIRVVKIELLS